jgi:hypothetical protein
MRDNPRYRRQRGARNIDQRACDIADKETIHADYMAWIELWLSTYDRVVFEFGWRA